MNYGNVDKHVKVLIEKGLVEEKWYGRMGIRMVRPSAQNIVSHLKKGWKLKIEVEKIRISGH